MRTIGAEKLIYNTRDGKGNDIVKEVKIKQFDIIEQDFKCMCGKNCTKGTPIKKIVSSNFTDWAFVSPFVCVDCSKLFSLYFYNYITDPNGIRLFNIREMVEEIQREQKPPFRIIVTTSQKKHLFYKSKPNDNSKKFYVNLEGEQIYCNIEKLREQFLFVGSMQTLGQSKTRLKEGDIDYKIFKQLGHIGHKCLKYLSGQLKTRQIQIPLYLSQKLEITEEKALCNLDLILNQ